MPVNRKEAVCDGFNGARFQAGPKDTQAWPDVVPTMSKGQANECIRPDGFGSIRGLIEKSVDKYGWIHLAGYNDTGAPPIELAGPSLAGFCQRVLGSRSPEPDAPPPACTMAFRGFRAGGHLNYPGDTPPGVKMVLRWVNLGTFSRRKMYLASRRLLV